MIFAIPYYGTVNWWAHKDRNALHRGVPLSTKKLAAASKTVDCDKIKELATMKKTTVGSMVSAFLSVALHRYFARNGNKFGPLPDGPIPKSITIGMPMSLRPPCKDLTTVKFYNKIAAMPYQFHIIEDFDQAVKHYDKSFKALKKSPYPFACYFLAVIVSVAPFGLD